MSLTELIEILEPQFFKRSSYLFRSHVFEQSLHFVHCFGASTFFGHFFFQKFHEVRSDWCINEHISVQPRVVIILKYFNVPHLREIPKRINIVHKKFQLYFILQTFNQVDNIVELIPDGDHIQKIDKHARGVALHILDFVSQFSFESGTHQRH